MLYVDFIKFIRLKIYIVINFVIYLYFLILLRIIFRLSRMDLIQEVLVLDLLKYLRSVSSIILKENMVLFRMKLMIKLLRQINYFQLLLGVVVFVVCCECVLFVFDEFWEFFFILINFRMLFMCFRLFFFKKEMNGLFN